MEKSEIYFYKERDAPFGRFQFQSTLIWLNSLFRKINRQILSTIDEIEKLGI